MKCEQFNMLVVVWWMSCMFTFIFPSLSFLSVFYPFIINMQLCMRLWIWHMCECYECYEWVIWVIWVIWVKVKRCSPHCKPLSRLQTSRSLWLSVNNHRVHTHSLLRHWARRRQCIVLLCVSLKRTKCNNTGDPFRSGVLKVMSLARFLCATPVTWLVTAFYVRELRSPNPS